VAAERFPLRRDIARVSLDFAELRNRIDLSEIVHAMSGIADDCNALEWQNGVGDPESMIGSRCYDLLCTKNSRSRS
jgi:hypothetical protein